VLLISKAKFSVVRSWCSASIYSYLILLVSQFTLLASTKKGNKPDFHGAAGGEHAKILYDTFVNKVRALYENERVKDGVFQAMMDVGLVNDGPVTIELEVSSVKKDGKRVPAAEPGTSMTKEGD
jgi:D-aminoacyl-tRNA deacylase